MTRQGARGIHGILKTGVTGLLLAVVLAAVVTAFPSEYVLTTQWWYGLMFVALTAISLPLSVLFSRGELSFTHAVGVVAFLSFSSEMLPLMIWSVALGGFLGGGLRLWRQDNQLFSHLTPHHLQSVIATTARVLLSFYFAAYFYILIDGRLPLRAGSNEFVPPLVLYGIFYVSLYALLYALELYIQGHDVVEFVRADSGAIVLVLTLPIAYSILVAILHDSLPLELFFLGVMGLALSIVVTFSYSRNQSQLRQQLDEMHALSNLSQELQASTDPTALIRALELHLPKILHAEHLLIATVDGMTGEVSYPLVMEQGERQYGAAPSEQEKKLIDRVLEGSHTPHNRADSSWVCVPMRARSRSIGTIAMRAAPEQIVEDSDVRLMRIIAPTLAAALENAQLYQQQQERVMRLNTLNTISVLLSSTLSPEDVLDTITSSAAMLSEANAVTVYLMDSEDVPRLQRSAGLSDAFLDELPPPLLRQQVTPAEDTIIQEYPPLLVEDVRREARLAAHREQYLDEGILSLIELPLVSGEHLLGEVVLYYPTSKPFDREFVEFLRTFASEAVQAIKNAQLYARTDEALEQRLFQLSILAAVGQQTNASIDLQTISDVVLGFALGYTQAARGVIALYGRETRQLRVIAQQGYDEALPDMGVFQRGVFHKALQTKQYFHIQNADDFANVVRLMPSTSSQIVVPVLRDREVLGLVVLEDDAPDVFSKEDTRFIVQLFNQAAIAIDNRNLFQAVVRSRDRMQVILDAMTEAIVLVNTSSEIVLANPAVQMIGLEPDALLGQRLDQLMQDADIVRSMGFQSSDDVQRLLGALRRGDHWQVATGNFTVHKPNHLLYIERQVIPIRAEDKSMVGMLLIFYDQTKQVELDRTRDDFTRMIVHDLRSPLTAITTSLRLIPRLLPPEMEQRESIEKIVASGDQVIHKMVQRVDSLLDVAKMESGEIKLDKQPFDLIERVQHVFDELSPLAADREVDLRQEMNGIPPHVYADSDKIERVIQNLVDNALKHTAKGSQVIVRGQNADNEMLQVEVLDWGPGVPVAYRERLFERFVQIGGQEGDRRGVGLGLTFCRLVVEAHGGRIWIDDNPDGGSIFAFTLQKAPTSVK